MKLKKSPKPTTTVKRIVNGQVTGGQRIYWAKDIERQIWIRERVAFTVPRYAMFTKAYTDAYPVDANLDMDEHAVQARIQAFLQVWRMKPKAGSAA